MTTLELSSTVSKSDLCYNCHATARYHLQNPFGVYFQDSVLGRVHKTWVQVSEDGSGNEMSLCNDYVVNGNVTLDHDMLYMSMSS